MSCCSICLNSIRKTRSVSELPCGHLFHKQCISKWEQQGKETCPLCRRNISNTMYRVTLTIENLRKNRISTINLNFQDIRNILDRLQISDDDLDMASTDVVFDAADLESLQSILVDFGISGVDIDASILDTE